MSDEFDPYHKWLGISPDEQPPDHYRLLGVRRFESDIQVIEAAADRQLTFLKKLKLGQHSRQANSLMNEVTQAWRVLAHPEKKSAYDANLNHADDDALVDWSNEPRPRPTADPRMKYAVLGAVACVFLVGGLIWSFSGTGATPSRDSSSSVAAVKTEPAETSATPPAGNGAAVSQPVSTDSSSAAADFKGPADRPEEQVAKSDSNLPSRSDAVTQPDQGAASRPAVVAAKTAKLIPVDYRAPRRVSVLPVIFIPNDQQPPTSAEQEKFLRHIKWARDRYRELLAKDTFELAEREIHLIQGRKPLDYYRLQPERGAPDIIAELLADLKVNRFQCPYTFCILLMNQHDGFPEGGGRPLNGGLGTGGGMMYISSHQLEHNEHFQCTLQHELGHAFGLPHVDVYGYDMMTNPSLMSYNPAHHNKGFEPSKSPGIFIPEDLRALALNKRVFPTVTFDLKRDVPVVYSLSKRIVTLGPMSIPGHPNFYPKITTSSGEDMGSKITNLLETEIIPSAGPNITYSGDLKWQSERKLPDGKARVQISFQDPITLSSISIHSQHSGIYHKAVAVRIQVPGPEGSMEQRDMANQSLTAVDQLVTFKPTVSRTWNIELTADETQTVVLRGLRFFDGNDEVCPHQIPYRNAVGVDDIRPATVSGPGGIAIAQATGKLVLPTKGAAKSEKLDSNPAANAGEKVAVPDAAALTAARKAVREKFKSEFAQAKKPEGKLDLAASLIDRASEIEKPNAEQYVMLQEALDLAADADNQAIAKRAIDALVERFEVSPHLLQEQVLSAVALSGKTFQEGLDLLAKYLDLAKAAAEADDYAGASKIMTAGAGAMKKPLYKSLKEYANQEAKRYGSYQDAFAVARTARDKLTEQPDDAAANLQWGRFVCCFKNDWGTGLPLLAKSDDKVWKSLAERELKRPESAADLLKLGDDWLKAGDKEKDPVQSQTRIRADLAWSAALETAGDLDGNKIASLVDQRTGRLFERAISAAKGDPGGLPLIGTEPFNPGNEFTLEFWVATKAISGVLLSKQHAGADASMVVRLSSRDNVQLMHLEYAHASGGGGTDSGNPISDGRWHHVAMTINGDRIILYIDGKSHLESTLQENQRLLSNSPWKLGCGKNGPPMAAQFAKIRISNVVRYPDEFTPSKQFQRDLSTLFLK